ncbi:MAG: glycosyltransferase, partial [bacterium]|nr:glycosyltransferase [bacterium]
MKVLLDLQPLMTGSRFRGIGRYTLNHAKSFIKQNNNDEIFLLINDSCSGSLEFVRNEFSEFVSDDHIVICRYPLSVFDSDIEWLKAGAAGAFELFQLIREAFISSLHPDFVLIYSHFEFAFSASSIKKYSDIPTGVIVYDFIPYHEKMFSGWMLDSYNEKIESLKNADIILCISDYISKDAESIIDVGASGAIKPIGTGKDGFWKNIDVSDEEKQAFFKKFGLDKDFILYAGGIEGRKNVKKLVEAYSLLSEEIKENNSLFIICGKHEKEQKELEQFASSCGISGHAVFGGYVSNEDLRMAYSLCRLFVFPSLSEGFGLTPLEAMSCGAPAIASDRTSIPEVIGMERALFDPEDAESIKAKIEEALTDEAFYGSLKSHALIQSEKFSWDSIAFDTWKHIKDLFADKSFCDYDAIDLEDCIGLAADCLNKDKSWDLPLSDRLLKEISECIAGIYNENNEKSKKIFLELSVLDTVDAGSGIQRVSKNILKHLPSIAAGYDVVPVKMCNGGYEYCRKFASNPRSESFAYPSRNDLFFFPELSMLQITENINYFLQMKERGIRLVSMVYDRIPVKYPETCSDTVAEHFSESLKSVAQFDGVVC